MPESETLQSVQQTQTPCSSSHPPRIRSSDPPNRANVIMNVFHCKYVCDAPPSLFGSHRTSSDVRHLADHPIVPLFYFVPDSFELPSNQLLLALASWQIIRWLRVSQQKFKSRKIWIRRSSTYASMGAIVCRASPCNYPTVTTVNRVCVPDLSRADILG
jgi:hypothetical protein